ncbi:MAG: hypothetical protein ACLSGS_03895 [Adlercreutzia sp.]
MQAAQTRRSRNAPPSHQALESEDIMDARTASSCPRARHRLRALLSLFLTVTLATSLLPAPAFAAASAGDGAAVQTAVAAAEATLPPVDGKAGR